MTLFRNHGGLHNSVSVAYMGKVRKKMDYKHCRCECGGIIGQYSKAKGFNCERCNKEYQLSELNFDWIALNEKTGWLFPMLKKEDAKC